MQIDDSDRRLLRQLQADPELASQPLAERAGMSLGAVARRLEKLRRAGIYQGTRAVIDWPALGFTVEVSLRFTLDKTDPRAFDEFLAAAREVPEVHEIQTFLGRVDVRLNILARDLAHYRQIYRERILTLPHISEIEALMHLAEIQKDGGLPL